MQGFLSKWPGLERVLKIIQRKVLGEKHEPLTVKE